MVPFALGVDQHGLTVPYVKHQSSTVLPDYPHLQLQRSYHRLKRPHYGLVLEVEQKQVP